MPPAIPWMPLLGSFLLNCLSLVLPVVAFRICRWSWDKHSQSLWRGPKITSKDISQHLAIPVENSILGKILAKCCHVPWLMWYLFGILFHLVVEIEMTNLSRSAPSAFNLEETKAVTWLPDNPRLSVALQMSIHSIILLGNVRVTVSWEWKHPGWGSW